MPGVQLGVVSLAVGGVPGTVAVRRGSRLWRSSNWQKGHRRAAAPELPSASRYSLPQRWHRAMQKLGDFAIHSPSVWAARSKARSKLMREGGR